MNCQENALKDTFQRIILKTKFTVNWGLQLIQAWIQQKFFVGGYAAVWSTNYHEFCPQINVICLPQAKIFEYSSILVAFGALF
jgi:hypothetical protein